MFGRREASVLGLVLVAGAAAYASAEAVDLLAGTDNYVYDGFCFEGEDPSYGFAAAVVPGICLAVGALARGFRQLRGAEISTRLTLGFTVAAGVWLVGWSAAAFLSNMAFADQESAPLPAILCTYENPPFDATR